MIKNSDIKEYSYRKSISVEVLIKPITFFLISLYPLILFKTMEMLIFNGEVYPALDIYYGSKALILNILILPMILLLVQKLKHKFEFKHFNIWLFSLVFWAFISAIASDYRMTSFFGWPFRWQGAYTYFLYLVIYVFITIFIKHETIIELYRFLYISAGIISLYGILQFYQLEPLKNIFVDYLSGDLIDGQIRSTIGNRNFFGSYMCLVTLSSMYKFVFNEKKNNNLKYLVMTLLFFAGLVASLTRGVWLGFSGAIILMLFLSISKFSTTKEKLSVLLLSFVIIISLMNWTSQGKVFSRIENASDQISIAQHGDVGQLGSGRMYIYMRSFEIFLENPIFGTGPDSLGYHFTLTKEESMRVFHNENTICVDKTHSEYLEYLTTMGLPGLILYLGFIQSLLIPAFKIRHKFDSTSWGIFAAVIGYLLQATFNIGVISVLPLFFTFLAFLHIATKHHQECLLHNINGQSCKQKSPLLQR